LKSTSPQRLKAAIDFEAFAARLKPPLSNRIETDPIPLRNQTGIIPAVKLTWLYSVKLVVD
jgi:hypothetical protein